MAAIHGRTTKIKRYYWRELSFREFEILAEAGLPGDALFDPGYGDARKDAEDRALRDIKHLHETSPKYVLDTESEAKFLERLDVRVRSVKARARAGGEVIHPDGLATGPEEFAIRVLEAEGFSCVKCESVPFHCLFSVFLWRLIQDDQDELQRAASFGERASFEAKRQSSRLVHTVLPYDFGTSGYSERRAVAIERSLKRLALMDSKSLIHAFDLAVPGSEALRQYLWAHRKEDLARARRLVEVLPSDGVRRILRYLVSDYWRNYLGWPDIVASRGSEVLFVEVKLSADKLSDDQRHWIEENKIRLLFPFEILKIHRLRAVEG